MINGVKRNDEDSAAEPSDRLVSLVLKIDAALHEGRSLDLPETSLNELSPEERRQFDSAHCQLKQLYAKSPLTERSPPKTADTRVDVGDDEGSDQTDFSWDADLQSFLGMHGGKFGRFEVLRGLGMGGHGVVFLARDPLLDRMIALKVPRPDTLVLSAMRKRFVAEGRAAALLTHPNIVTVFESGEVGSICYLAQDYISGPSLATWLKVNCSPVLPRLAAELLLPLTEAVALAHSRNILHRDIKPANILLAPKSSAASLTELSEFVPKLADFGLAKLLLNQDQTRTGGVLGTPAYMSPEQAAGHKESVGAPSDIYSLGAVLYELLTHNPVHRGDNDLETLQQVLHFDPPSLRTQVSDIPRDLEAICLKCLLREPRDRYRSAYELADDLRRFLDGRTVLARPQSTVSALYRWSRRNPAIAALSSAVFTAMLTMLGISLRYNAKLNESLLTLREQQRETERHQQESEKREFALRRRVYADDLNLAGKAWANSDLEQVKKRLESYIPQNDSSDFRSFPWWFLWRLSQESSQVVGHHPGGVSALVVDDSGTLAASAGVDGVIRLWKLPHGKPAGELRGHEAKEINCLDFSSASGHLKLASASDDGTVRVWDVASFSCERILGGDHGWVAVARFLGSHAEAIATAGEDKLIRIWDSRTGTLLRDMSGHTDVVRDLCENPANHLLASTSEDKTVRLWNWQTGEPAPQIPDGKLDTPHGAWAGTLSLNQNRTVLTGGFRTGELYFWHTGSEHDGQAFHGRKLPMGGVRTLDWRDDESLLIGTESTILFARLALKDRYGWEPLRGHTERVTALKAMPATGCVISADRGGSIRWWPKNHLDGDLAIDTQLPNSGDAPQWSSAAFAVSFSSHQETEVLGFAPENWKPKFRIHLPQTPDGYPFYLSHDGQVILTTEDIDEQQVLSAYSTAEGTRLWLFPLPPSRPNAGAFSPNGQNFALCCNYQLRLISVRDGHSLLTLEHPRAVQTVQFCPDGSALVTACADGNIRTWNAVSGELLHTLVAHTESVTKLSLSQDGRMLATAGEDRIARVWNLSNWTEIASFSLDAHPWTICLLDEGETLAVVGDTKLVFWDVSDQVQLMEYSDAWGDLRHVAFSPDRKTISVQDRHHIRLLRGSP